MRRGSGSNYFCELPLRLPRASQRVAVAAVQLARDVARYAYARSGRAGERTAGAGVGWGCGSRGGTPLRRRSVPEGNVGDKCGE